MGGDVRRLFWRFIPSFPLTSRPARARYTTTKPVLESLEGRQLLALFTGFSHVRNIPTNSGVYSLQIDGPGVLKTQPAGGGSFDVKVLGTTDASTLTITQVRPRFHVANNLMSIDNLTIRSGQIGSILASPVELDGTMTRLSSDVGALEFGALGPGAQIDVKGSVSTMDVGSVNLGPGGHVVITGDLNGAFQSQSLSSSSTTAMTMASMNLDGGQFIIGRDSLGPISIAGDLSLSHNGLLAIGRDQAGTLSVGGSVIIDSGGQISVGRNLAALTVGGNVLVDPGASGIVVGGDLDAMNVGGYFRGQGSATAIDLGVGLNLNSLTVEGNGTSTSPGGIQSANINVGKNISALDVSYGIFRSWITAGVSINGVTAGADGVTAVYHSEIDAGTSITNVTLGGALTSGFPTGDTTGYPTRIIAGKIRSAAIGSTPDQGLYLPDGTISGFAIDGSLINSVLAASVAPYGGDGSLPPPVPYGGTPRTSGPPPAGFSNYNAPGGLTDIGNGQNIKNYSIRSYVGGQLVPTAVYDTAIDPNIHVNVLDGGTINATVSGSVVSTPHDDTFDFTGVFAVNTVGVNGGLEP
ncbi:MAG: hypothetical protein ACLP53_21420 [Isosphaeraceae bacterium]